MNTDPNNIDLSELNRQQLQELVNSTVQDRCRETGAEFMTCWNQCKLLFPKLFAASAASLNGSIQRVGLPSPGSPASRPGTERIDGAGRLANPFPVNKDLNPAIANDMSTADVRKTYGDCLKKHLADHPDDGIIEAHSAVMKNHPALAAAMRKKRASQDGPANATDDDALANSATALANCKDADEPFLMRSNGDGWASIVRKSRHGHHF